MEAQTVLMAAQRILTRAVRAGAVADCRKQTRMQIRSPTASTYALPIKINRRLEYAGAECQTLILIRTVRLIVKTVVHRMPVKLPQEFAVVESLISTRIVMQ
jgi:hypothetical protein